MVPAVVRVPVAATRLVPVVVLADRAKAATPVVPVAVRVPVVDPAVPAVDPVVPVPVGVRVGNVAHRVVPVGGVVVATRTSCNHSS